MIEMITYKNRWLREFNLQKKKIEMILQDKALGIHHIGGTSLPDISARDIIDMQLTVSELTTDIEQRLKIIGYSRVNHISRDHRPRGYNQVSRKQLVKWLFIAGTPEIQLHVRLENSFNQRSTLLCRDYLRAQPYAAKAYEEMKKKLTKHFANDDIAYGHIKNPVFDIILDGAELWAEKVGWRPSLSD